MATWLVIARPWDPGAGALTTLYLSDRGLVTEPSDTPANTYFDRRVTVPMQAVRSLYSGTDIGGPSETSFGEIVVANLDGALDGWADYEWAGREVELRYSAAANPGLGDFATVATHTVESITVGDEVQITLADAQLLLDTPYQAARFAGTGGAEGGDVLKDVRKPRPLGFPAQVEPVSLVAASGLFGVADGAIGGIERLLDRGVELIPGPDYADVTSLLAASTTGFDVLTCDALGLLRTTAPPLGPLTADVAGRTRGASLVTNGAFAGNLTGWAAGTGWAYSAGAAAKTAGVASSLSQTVTTVAGRWYVLRAMVTRSAGTLQPKVAGAALGTALAGTRRFVRRFLASSATTTVAFEADATFVGAVDAVEVVEVLARAADLVEFIVGADAPASVVFETGTVAALNAICAQPLGHWFGGGDGGDLRTVLTAIVNSVGGWWGVSLANRLQLGRFDAPAATAAFSFEARDILSFEPTQTAARTRKQDVRFARRWRTLAEQDLAASVTGTTRTALLAADEVASASDAGVAAASPRAEERSRDTLLVQRGDADAEAARLIALFGPARRSAEVTVPYTPGLDVGQTISLAWPRYGLSSGARFVVLRAEPSIAGDVQTHALTVWR